MASANNNQSPLFQEAAEMMDNMAEAHRMETEFVRLAHLRPPVLLERIARPSLGEKK